MRWVLLKDVGLLSDDLTLFLHAVFALQRRRARRQGLRGGQVGAVSFIQFFGSALQVTPHFHSLVPDGVFVPEEGGVRFEPLPPPTQGEVERRLKVVRHRVLRLLENQGAARLLHQPGLLLGRPRQRPSSAPALQPSPSTWPLSRLL